MMVSGNKSVDTPYFQRNILRQCMKCIMRRSTKIIISLVPMHGCAISFINSLVRSFNFQYMCMVLNVQVNILQTRKFIASMNLRDG